jgi:hypothetical protein
LLANHEKLVFSGGRLAKEKPLSGFAADFYKVGDAQLSPYRDHKRVSFSRELMGLISEAEMFAGDPNIDRSKALKFLRHLEMKNINRRGDYFTPLPNLEPHETWEMMRSQWAATDNRL